MKEKIINFVLSVMSFPIVLFEYMLLFWFWGGADIYNFILTPVIFITYLISLTYFTKKIKKRRPLSLPLKILVIISLPILTIITVLIFAILFGINIVIM